MKPYAVIRVVTYGPCSGMWPEYLIDEETGQFWKVGRILREFPTSRTVELGEQVAEVPEGAVCEYL